MNTGTLNIDMGIQKGGKINMENEKQVLRCPTLNNSRLC
jgi:hypothetical protein